MRYLRKLLIMTAALAAVAAMTATAASATVEVKDATGELCEWGNCDIEFGGMLEFEQVSGTFDCQMDISMSVSSSGELDFYSIAASPGHPWCASVMNDCNNWGWWGQILAPGDDGFAGVDDFDAVVVTCFQAQGWPAEIRIGIDDVLAPPPYEEFSYQSWSLEEQDYGSPSLTIKGDAFDANEDGIRITDVE